MTYDATVQFKFDATFTPTYGSGFGSTVIEDYIPEEHYLITAPAADLNSTQYFKLFEKFLLCVGMCPSSIRSGAMSLVFNDYVNEKDQRKVCKEYELTMDEDLRDKFKEWQEAEAEFDAKVKGMENVEALYWKNKYIAELSEQGKLEEWVERDEDVKRLQEEIETARKFADSANGVV